jgi:hypothetical protein
MVSNWFPDLLTTAQEDPNLSKRCSAARLPALTIGRRSSATSATDILRMRLMHGAPTLGSANEKNLLLATHVLSAIYGSGTRRATAGYGYCG